MSRYRRYVLLGLVTITPLAVHPSGDDVFNLPKAILVVVGSGLLLALFLREWVARGALRLAPRTASMAIGAFAIAVLLVTATTGPVGDAIFGASRRYTGTLLYLSLAVVLLCVAVDFRSRDIGSLVRAIVVGGGFVAAYGLLQVVGLDPVPWMGTRVNSTLGNTNFMAAHMAIVATLASWLVLQAQEHIGWRAVGGSVLVGSVVAMLAAAAAQGVLALVGGLAVMGLVWGLGAMERRIRLGYVLGAVAGVLVLGGGLVLALQIDPLGALRGGGVRGGATARVELAQAGLGMWRDHSVLGVGMDQFGSFVRQYRPESLADQVSLRWGASEAHSVPVNMLATGGLVLAIPYLAVMAAPFLLAWRGLRSGAADGRLLAVMAGGFSAYLLQAFVSVDIPPLALTGWALAGGVVVASGAEHWELLRSGRTRRVPAPMRIGVTVLAGAVVVCVVVGGLRVLDADQMARLSRVALQSEQPDVAVTAAEKATRQAGWWPEYWLLLGQAHEATGDTDEAMAALETAYEQDPRDFAVLLSAARLRAAHGMDPTIWYERAVAVDPTSDELAEEAAPYVAEAS